MPNASDYFSGKYATSSQLPKERHITAVIDGVTEEVMQQTKDTKLVLHLSNTTGRAWQKGVVLNVGNGKALIAAYGENTDDWVGKRIELWSEATTFGGKPTTGIRLKAAGNGHSTPMPPSTPEPKEPGGGELSDEIPWAPCVQ